MAFGGDKYISQTQNKMKHLNYGRIGLNPETLCVIKLPDSLVLRIISRSLFLAVVIITLPCIRTIFRARTTASEFHPGSDLIPSDQLDLFLRDFLDQGLLKTGQKALILNPAVEGLFQDLKRLDSIEFELVATSDFEQRSSLVENSYDFIFMSISVDPNLVDLAVKVDGIVAVPLSSNPSSASPSPFLSNYRIVYLRKDSSMIMGMKKTSQANHYSASSRRLCQTPLEPKRRALKGLEDVLLEPPRTSLEKPKKIKYLPDLTGDSLRDYRQRIFIGVGLPEETKAMVEWFEENYPKQGQKFEFFTMDATAEREEEVSHGNENDVCDWLTKNAKESEYVVMKAEAEVVEKMMKKRAIHLVDELFLECRNQWWGEKEGKRAYWECVALYGKLRDEGVAVHQWWN